MFLARLIYASKVNDNVNLEEVEKIITTAQKNNTELGVTGILIYNNQYFLQALEGGRNEVNQIYHKILNDKRHSDPTIIDYREIAERTFSDWSMKLYLDTKSKKNLNLKYSSQDTFDPFNLSAESALLCLKEITEQN